MNSSPFYVEAKVDTTQATIGAVISYQVWARAAGERQIDFPAWQLDTTEFQIRSIEPLNGEYRDDFGREYQITVWDTGRLVLPEHPVEIREADGSGQFIMWTDRIPLQVNSTLLAGGQGGLRPIKGPVPVSMPLPWRTIILISTLVLLLTALPLLWRKRQRNEKQQNETVVPTEPPDKIALAKIEHLEVKKIWESGQFKEFYYLVSYLLREYIENSIYFKTLEMTTTEIAALHDIIDVDRKLFSEILALLSRSDMIKFARQIPTGDRCRSDLELARQFVRQTTIRWNRLLQTEPCDSKFETTAA